MRIALLALALLCITTVAGAEETREYYIQKGDKQLTESQNAGYAWAAAKAEQAIAYYLRALLTEKGGSENEIPIDMFSHTDEPKPCQN